VEVVHELSTLQRVKYTVMIDPKDLEEQLQEALKESAYLREENERLKKLLGLYP